MGGLTAAIGLRQRGFEVAVYEAANTLAEVGAGLTLGLGAQHVFRALGIQNRLAAIACPAGTLPFVHFRTGELVFGALDPGNGLPDDGAENIVRHCYRADLQKVLVDALEDLGVRIATGHAFAKIDQLGTQVEAHFTNGHRVKGDVLVGADGIKSTVRAMLFPQDVPRFTGHVAYRFLVDAHAARPFMGLGRSAIYIGPQRTFNRYTMSQGRVINCAGLVETDQAFAEGWSHRVSLDELHMAFAGWHPDVLGLIESADQCIKWGLYDRAPAPVWSNGPVTLLGDSAHAMLPFLGMGAAMAIEDGYVLSRAFELEPDVPRALARYEAARKPRTELVHRKSFEQGQMTQALDPDDIDLSNIPMLDQAMMGFNPVEADL